MVGDSSLQVMNRQGEEVRARRSAGRLRRWRDLVREDIQTVYAKDPAARSLFEVLTCYPGLHATWLHRIAHGLWKRNRRTLSRMVSHMSRFFTGVEIHPGARIGRRFFIDHGAGVVIGETSEIGDDVLMYQGAVLGGTSSERTKRHPTIGNGTVIGAHAVVLGNIAVGEGVKVGSGSVVVEPVPAGATVVGVPGRITQINGRRLAKRGPDVLDHARLPDPVVETLKCLVDRVELLEKQIRDLTRTSPIDWQEDLSLECTWIGEG
jgi:serine O-acetyltransferase